jgi:hypothetical protein
MGVSLAYSCIDTDGIPFNTTMLSNCMIGFLTALEFQDSYWHYNTVYAYDRKGDFVWWQDSHQLMVKTTCCFCYDYNTYIDHYHAIIRSIRQIILMDGNLLPARMLIPRLMVQP